MKCSDRLVLIVLVLFCLVVSISAAVFAALIALPPSNSAGWVIGNGIEDKQGIGLGLFSVGGIDSYTKLLLHMDGTDASTSFPDSSGTGKSTTAFYNVQVDTGKFVFNGASGMFDGTSDYISVAHSTDFDFGTGDFTIDTRIWFNSAGSGIMGKSNATGTNNKWMLAYGMIANNLNFHYYSAGNHYIHFPWVPTLNTWYHLALVRSGDSWYLFIDGVQTGGTQTYATAVPDTTPPLRVGWDGAGELSSFNGWLDETRISKGIARWTANFTPPVEAYYVYSSLSPVAESPWVSINESVLNASSPTLIQENKIAALLGINSTGTIAYKYALNNGAYNDSWLSHAQLVANLAGASITNHTNSLKLKAQFNSDGTQMADIVPQFINAHTIGGYPLQNNVRISTVYGLNNELTGTMVNGSGNPYPYGVGD